MFCTRCSACPGPVHRKTAEQIAPGRGHPTQGFPSTSAPFAFPRLGGCCALLTPHGKPVANSRVQLGSTRPFRTTETAKLRPRGRQALLPLKCIG